VSVRDHADSRRHLRTSLAGRLRLIIFIKGLDKLARLRF
jgi:hypothetical protein